MGLTGLEEFREVWAVDFEFTQPDGERPAPICMVAREVRSGTTLRLWRHDLAKRRRSPIPVRDDVLFVAFYASAEMGCYRALGWPMPTRVLDLFTEFRARVSGLCTPCGEGLLGALAYHGLPAIEAADKQEMRALAMRGGPYTAGERRLLTDYCGADVDALVRLLPAMLPRIDLGRALIRGRFMCAAAQIEWTGTPLDVATLVRLRRNWESIQQQLVEAIDKDFGVYDGRRFKAGRFARYLADQQIPWPRLESGALDLGDDTFRQMAKAYPQVAPLRELRHAMSQLRLNDLAVGADGRNRCLLSAFRAKTGRNQPSNTKFIFGPSAWLRSLIKPGPGRAVAYVDYSQQEVGIAAALSGDATMMDAYDTSDPYLEFAKQAGAVPRSATKASHPAVRERFKACVLAVQYMMGAQSLARRAGVPEPEARELLRLHRQTYPRFWAWSQSALDRAMLTGTLSTVFGWPVHVGGGTVNPRSLANFPMQANGAEMLRLACCLLTEHGVEVCAPVHDAVLVEGPADRIGGVVAATEALMREASGVVLGGFTLRTDAKVVAYPDRYTDPRGRTMWDTTMRILARRP